MFAFTRTLGTIKSLVVLNFKEKEVDHFRLEMKNGGSWTGLKWVLGNYYDDDVKEEEQVLRSEIVLHLKAYEGRVYLSS